MAVSTIYVMDIGTRVSTPHSMHAQSVPYYSLDLLHQIQAANTATFESPEYYAEGSRVQIQGDHKPFGGTIEKRTEKTDGYSYECIDFTKQFFGQFGNGGFENVTASQVLKFNLIQLGLPTSGIVPSTVIWPNLVFNNAKVIDVFHQLAYLDGKEFYMNPDGIPIFDYPHSAIEGWIFTPNNGLTDYGLVNDTSNLITYVSVIGADDNFLFREWADDGLVATYGSIQEVINDSNLTTEDQAKTAADNLLAEKARVDISGNITIPTIMDIGGGEWCAFRPPSWSKSQIQPYYIQSVKTSITPDNQEQTLTLLNGKPTPPDEWVYTNPDGTKVVTTSSQVCSQTPGVDSVCGSMKPTCKYCVYNKVPWKEFYKCWVNKCPFCGGKLLNNPKHADGGEWTCASCGADFCGVCGHEKLYPARKILTPSAGQGGQTTCTNVSTTTSPPAPTITATGIAACKTPQQVRQWVDAHIKYSFYWNCHYTDQQVLKQGWGNCCDQTHLCMDYIAALGYKVRRIHTTCSGLGHYNWQVLLNGRWVTGDTVCSHLNQL